MTHPWLANLQTGANLLDLLVLLVLLQTREGMLVLGMMDLRIQPARPPPQWMMSPQLVSAYNQIG